MKPFSEQIKELCALGYRQAAAQARVAHDAVLLAMDRCGFKAKSTVKGGVVMSHITNDIRRTTMDMDIAFIKRSISDLSVERFIRRLNCIKGVRMSMFGTVGELLHDDYRGKRVYLDVKDSSISTPIRMKLDIGVHVHGEIAQLAYRFDLADANEKADLYVNPQEQIFAEKLQSLLRLRALSRRPKDIFDLCYLCDKVDVGKLNTCLDVLIYSNKKMLANSKEDVVNILKDIFASRQFMKRLSSARANWLEISPDLATNRILSFIESI